jgi:hypothetical protein
LEEHGPDRRREYKGKQDLDALGSPVGEFLTGLQAALNESLRLEKQDVPEHVEHPPFHLDYIDSSVRNAIAFCFEGFSFIGITIPLIYSLWDACIRLSSAERIAELLNVSQTPEQIEALHSVFFRIQLFFVVSHEYTHQSTVTFPEIPRSSKRLRVVNQLVVWCNRPGRLMQTGTQPTMSCPI